jgi:hypothetical protein
MDLPRRLNTRLGRICAFVAGVVLVASCSTKKPPRQLSPADAKAAIADRHAAMLEALTNRDFKAFAQFVYPTDSLLMSAEAWVGDGGDPRFPPARLECAADDTTSVPFGYEDGSGIPFYSTLQAELGSLAVGRYQDADSVSFNSQIHGGNTANNISEVYPGSIVVEYYFAGTGPQADFTWWSTRFVWVKHRDTWYLAAIANDHWTI